MSARSPEHPPRRLRPGVPRRHRGGAALGVLLRAARQLRRHRRAGARVRLQPRLDGAVDAAGLGGAGAGHPDLDARHGDALVEVALAVTLSSVRFLPMVAALLPMLRRPGTRQRDLLLPMHLTAISVWVEGMRLLPPRAARASASPSTTGSASGLMSAAVIGERDRLLSRGASCRRCSRRRCCSSRRWRS